MAHFLINNFSIYGPIINLFSPYFYQRLFIQWEHLLLKNHIDSYINYIIYVFYLFSSDSLYGPLLHT